MTDLDQLRGALRDLENNAPAAADVRARLDAQLGDHNRERHSRHVLSMAATAGVVAAVSAGLVLVASHQRDSSKPIADSRNSPRASLASYSQLRNLAAPAELSWRFAVAPVAGYDIKRVEIAATVQRADVTVLGNGKSVGEVDVFGQGAFTPADLAERVPATVDGRSGYFGTLNSKPTICWQYADGAWALVTGDWGYRADSQTYDLATARASEQSIANAVNTTAPSAFMVDFKLGWLPASLTVEQAVDVFGPNGTPLVQLGFGDGQPGVASEKSQYGGSALTVSRQLSAHPITANMEVGGRPAYYDATQLSVYYPDGTELLIAVDAKHLKAFSAADLEKIAANASVTPNPSDRDTWVTGAQALPN